VSTSSFARRHAQEEVVGKMNSLDKQREKKLKKVEEAQLFVDEGERKVASQEEQARVTRIPRPAASGAMFLCTATPLMC
jgi:hypothetical protein